MPYMTMDQCHDANADRHWQRGFIHSVMGRPDYAVGSYAKAMKWNRRAFKHREMFGHCRSATFQMIIDRAKQAFTDAVISGR